MNYIDIRDNINSTGADSRVEVNQRALIDKILARYASANAVYRELLQNSNDANAKQGEIYFTVDEGNVVEQVMYRNDGMPFRPQDWSRLKKIAEGNPDPRKVGAFGVGAYTMFSICEEPLVISGTEALAFVWKGDALWCKVAKHNKATTEWTSFILPSRDPYPVPDLCEFGEFLCASLTFTQSLTSLKVFVNGKLRLTIAKTTIQEPTIVEAPKSTSWWRNDGAVTTTPQGIFSLKNSILESRQLVKVTLDGESSEIQARYVSGQAKTKIPLDMVRRMERVTKKQPPSEVTVQIFIAGEERLKPTTRASRITASFLPEMGHGRVFIGFRTSQTTGLAAHLAAPLVPTVEREAIDLQDATLKVYNTELLEFAGMLMRLTLEHGMSQIGQEWVAGSVEREKLEAKLLKEAEEQSKKKQPLIKPVVPEVQKDEKESSGGFLSFAKFMAKGVTKQIVNVLSTVDSLLVEDFLLNPRDPLPLTEEERHAILLMRSFCPQQSTPDTHVGIALAQGFSRCLPNIPPPVLTKSGVIRGDQARLPQHGMEYFIKHNVVRNVVFMNAEEYHQLLGGCRRLNLEDLLSYLSDQILNEEDVVRMIQWWPRFVRTDTRAAGRGGLLKERIRFYPKAAAGNDVIKVTTLDSYIYYVDDKKIPKGLPLPETSLPPELQEEIGIRVLTDSALAGWFLDMSIDVWADFISNHQCIISGRPEDEKLRLSVLTALCKEYYRRTQHDRLQFGLFMQRLLSDKRCLPFDSSEPSQFATERPVDLYLNSTELKAFDGIGSFNKVSLSLKDAGVTDDFLLILGVRKSVAIDFLFSNLENLRWSDDPKPMIEYLRSASLTAADMDKLKTSQYLPAENDVSRTFSPQELYLPNSDLRIFTFVKLLQWPSQDDLTERSGNGQFLIRLGCLTHPPLSTMLQYLAEKVDDEQIRIRALDYIVKNLGPNGVYESNYSRLKSNTLLQLRFLPCLLKDPLVSASQKREIHSPLSCYSDPSCLIMGFPVLDPDVDKRSGNLYGCRFRCLNAPDAAALVSQLLHLVEAAKSKLLKASGEAHKNECIYIVGIFHSIFQYLSSRSSEFTERDFNSLKSQRFIPISAQASIAWYDPSDVYFKSSERGDSLTQELFCVVEFSPFLAAAGVRSEATTHDLFRVMLTNPEKILKTLGSEAKYRTLLRRIAANPPFRDVTPQIQNAPFLLGYKINESEDGTEEKQSYLLAKAGDIYIIDNSFFGRMFPVVRAPHESDLENFYVQLGSTYISKGVRKSFDIIGGTRAGTNLSVQLEGRIHERSPLLVSPSVTSRPLVKNASSLLDDGKLSIFEVDNLKAVYSLGSCVRNQRVTSCAKALGGMRNALYITAEFDWFDVGYAIGGLILQRCQLEDAFFIGSLLEAPLEQLRSRGFPVDRILSPPEPEPTPPPLLVPVAPAAPMTTSTPPNTSSSSTAQDTQKKAQREGVDEILQQMFPDCEDGYIQKRLGTKSTMDDVRSLAEEMSTGKYPKKQSKPDDGKLTVEPMNGASPSFDKQPKSEKKASFGRRIGKALSGIKHNAVGVAGGLAGATAGGAIHAAPQPNVPHSSPSNNGRPVAPEVDNLAQTNLEAMLKNQVGNSTNVNARGHTSEERIMTDIPDGLNRHEGGCEVIPGQSLKPFNGPYRSGMSHNGIRVFSSKHHPSSETFLQENFHCVDTFADVLHQLCGIYDLNLSSIAIFHDPTGGTIAFNAGKALHFNVRFFFSLHYSQNKQDCRDCYAYWYTTMAHELAHHLVSAHNKEHGYYTECYVALYLPKLVTLLTVQQTKIPTSGLMASKFAK